MILEPLIREQIKAGVWPVRLRPEDWMSGQINWLFGVIANFKQVIKEGDLRLHPLIARLVEPEMLEKMGAAPRDAAEPVGKDAQAN
jgi:hemolysin-activating ACP:hemolysin acyltransferase